jgi:tetratricopeptide (TPR) repeat protein
MSRPIPIPLSPLNSLGLLAALLLVSLCPLQGLSQPGPRQMAKVDLDEAVQLYQAGHLDSAMVVVERALSKDPELGAAYKLKGDILQKKKKVEEALVEYDRAEDLGMNDPRLFVSRAAARITGNLKGAIRDLDHALQYAPDDPDIHYNRACAVYLGGDNKAALKDLGRVLKLKPDYADALYLSGVIKGEEYREKEGLDEIEQALKLKPEIPGGLMSLGVLLFEIKDYENAIEKFTQVIDLGLDGKAEAYYYRGDCYYNLGDKVKACSDWTVSAGLGDKDAIYIKKNYCETEEAKIPKKPAKGKRRTVIVF